MVVFMSMAFTYPIVTQQQAVSAPNVTRRGAETMLWQVQLQFGGACGVPLNVWVHLVRGSLVSWSIPELVRSPLITPTVQQHPAQHPHSDQVSLVGDLRSVARDCSLLLVMDCWLSTVLGCQMHSYSSNGVYVTTRLRHWHQNCLMRLDLLIQYRPTQTSEVLGRGKDWLHCP